MLQFISVRVGLFKTWLASVNGQRWFGFPTKAVGLIGTMSALSVVLLLLSKLFPHLPQGGSLELQFLPLFILAFTGSFMMVFLASTSVGLLTMALGAYIVNPWQFLLDYFLPMWAILVAWIVTIKVIKRPRWQVYLQYVAHIGLPVILMFCCHVLSGVFYFSENSWLNWGPWAFSLSYNAIYISINFAIFLAILWPLYYRILMLNNLQWIWVKNRS